MVRWDVMRAPMSVQLLITLGSERGVPAEICLARTGLREEVLREPNVEVSAKQELTVVANLVSALGDPPGLGIEASATTSPPTASGASR
jgi:hypothetical protein